MATRPDIRVGDAEREATAQWLRENYAQGRLSLEEFNERLSAAFAAVTQRDLDELTTDLPPVRTPVAPLPEQSAGQGSGPGGGRQHSGIGAFAVLITALGVVAIWSIAMSPTLLGFRFFPLTGRIPFLVIGLLILRAIVRRIFGGRLGACSRGGRCGGRRW
jgi:hypothetical protein